MVGGLIIFSLAWSYDAWWKDNRSPFTFHSDGWFSGAKLGIDKTGHFFTSYFYFNTIRNIMLWGRYSRSNATWWAAGASEFFALAVEPVTLSAILDWYHFYGISISNGATYQRTAIDFRRGLSASMMHTHTGLLSTSMNCCRRPWDRTGLTFCSWRLAMG